MLQVRPYQVRTSFCQKDGIEDSNERYAASRTRRFWQDIATIGVHSTQPASFPRITLGLSLNKNRTSNVGEGRVLGWCDHRACVNMKYDVTLGHNLEGPALFGW